MYGVSITWLCPDQPASPGSAIQHSARSPRLISALLSGRAPRADRSPDGGAADPWDRPLRAGAGAEAAVNGATLGVHRAGGPGGSPLQPGSSQAGAAAAGRLGPVPV